MNDNSKAHVNDVIKTMLERSSIRAYTDEKLTQEQISLLECRAQCTDGNERTGSAVCVRYECGNHCRA